ncbi:MAG: aminoacyl-tRNA hydrolase [Thomasclavelia sp.]|nr:aminoacyl-tRNA hydrolase [Thomasclavelia sp.]
MKLIVGLGNPGKEYEHTRHNTGFEVTNKLADKLGVSLSTSKHKGLYAKTKYNGEDVIILQPQTFMNLSGESVQAVMGYFKVDIDDLIVIYDDLDMPVGKLRLRVNGSAGGHNGIKSIISCVGSQDFKRIRVGIGRLPYIKVVDYVLGRFTKEQQPSFDEGVNKAVEALIDTLDNDFTHAMNKYN